MPIYTLRNPVTLMGVTPEPITSPIPTRGGPSVFQSVPAGQTGPWFLLQPGLYLPQINAASVPVNYSFLGPEAVSGQQSGLVQGDVLWVVYPMWIQLDATGSSSRVDVVLTTLDFDIDNIKSGGSFVFTFAIEGEDVNGDQINGAYVGPLLSYPNVMTYAPTATGNTSVGSPGNIVLSIVGVDIARQAAGTGVDFNISLYNGTSYQLLIDLTPYPSGATLRFPGGGLLNPSGDSVELVLSGTVTTYPIATVYFQYGVVNLNQ